MRKLQPKSLASKKAITDDVLLTLLGIHLLQKHYGAKKTCWTLVVNKAFYAIQQAIRETQKKDMTRDEIQTLVNSLTVSFNDDWMTYEPADYIQKKGFK